MGLLISRRAARTALSRTGIPGEDYCLNPYVGCAHACRYCYATFMKRYTGHPEAWGAFVDIKENFAEVLGRELGKAKRGRVMVSSVTDPYQPVEARERLTRRCLEALLEHGFPVDVLTKSPLVVRDMDLLGRFEDAEVGITITTDDDRVRKAFEPHAPPIGARLRALARLREGGIRTYVFIGPLLPMDPERLARLILPHAGSVLMDRMNYPSKTEGVYRRLGLTQWLDGPALKDAAARLKAALGDKLSLCY
ncbi:MAG: radical SAM protein [Thermodesulfovibrionales bacterium]